MLLLLLSALLLCIGVVALPAHDPTAYGDFAGDDPRGGFRNAANVWSNVAFLVIGVIGVADVMRRRDALGTSFVSALTFFAAVVVTTFGSAWFHMHPLKNGITNPDTLLWDRLPITLACAALLALVLDRWLAPGWGNVVLPALIVLGFGSVEHWYRTGDLYPYAFFQFYALALPLLVMALDRRWSKWLLIALAAYVVAKICEDKDDSIYATFHVSGHMLKHLLAAAAAGALIRWLRLRDDLVRGGDDLLRE
jgi:hypothetical protein